MMQTLARLLLYPMLLVCGLVNGYYQGKYAADRWWQAHPKQTVVYEMPKPKLVITTHTQAEYQCPDGLAASGVWDISTGVPVKGREPRCIVPEPWMPVRP